MRKERVAWIDIARGIMIISIVLGHVLADGKIRWWLFSFHVPAFFFISGYCQRNYPDMKSFFIAKNKIDCDPICRHVVDKHSAVFHCFLGIHQSQFRFRLQSDSKYFGHVIWKFKAGKHEI